MRVGVVDVGANTARLLVAQTTSEGLTRIVEDVTPIALGAEIEERGGRISKRKRVEVADAVERAVATARAAEAHRVEVLVTSPGRQCSNPGDLRRALVGAAGPPVRLLSAREEARLAFAGALETTKLLRAQATVCDVGGGSAQIAVGTAHTGPTWWTSADIGSLRLTRRHVRSDPPRKRALRAIRDDVRRAVTEMSPPRAPIALATGGTARALRRMVGATLGPAELEDARALLCRWRAREISRRFDVPEWRARLLPAGAVVLSEVQQLIGERLTVARGGVREGAALQLLTRSTAAA